MKKIFLALPALMIIFLCANANAAENYPIANSDGATFRANLNAALAEICPPGQVMSYAGQTAPSGWLECNGAEVSRTAYPDLFASIGTTYGAGDGSTTFNLPDFRGYFLRGWDHGAGNDADAATRTDRGDGTAGDVVGTKQEDEFKNHTHTGKTESGGNTYGHTNSGNWYFTTYVPIGSTGGNETRPKNINVMYCIKY